MALSSSLLGSSDHTLREKDLLSCVHGSDSGILRISSIYGIGPLAGASWRSYIKGTPITCGFKSKDAADPFDVSKELITVLTRQYPKIRLAIDISLSILCIADHHG